VLSVAELRRLLLLLHESAEQRARRLWWSRFRRRHQAGAKRAHIAWRAAQHPAPALAPSSAQQVVGLSPLSDEQWERLQGLFVVPPHTPGRHQVDYRLIVEGILWLMRAGSPWRTLPTRFGAWSKVLYYYRQWKADGRWAHVQQALQGQEVLLCSSA
jgi:transposase